MAADTGADRAVHGERGGEERAEAEQAKDLSQQPVVALGLGAGLLPVRHLGDRAGAERRHRALHGVVRVAGIGQTQTDDLARTSVRASHRGGQCPDDPRPLAGAVAGLGAVGHAQDGQGACGAGHGECVPGLGPQRTGEAVLQDDSVGPVLVEPVTGDEQRPTGGGRLDGAAQLDIGTGAA